MLGATVRIATLMGIPVKVHWTFAFFFVWVIYIAQRMGLDMAATFRLCGFTIVLFFCVVLHELGHARMASRFGVRTLDIIISPIGGIARLMRIPEKPREELLIALAGPAVNLVIASVLFILLHFFTAQGIDIVGDPAKLIEEPSNFLPFLFIINLALIAFNLVPAFPMDGGRVFRSLLAMRTNRVRATKWAARVGHIIAVGFVAFGFWQGDFVLAFIGIFVLVSASGEYRSVKRESMLEEGTVKEVVRHQYTALDANDPLQKAHDLSRAGGERDFLVRDAWGGILGVLHAEFIEAARKDDHLHQPIHTYLSSSFEVVTPDVNLRNLVTIFQEKGYSIVPVQHAGEMIGVVDRNGLTQYVKKTPKLWAYKNS